MAAPPPHTHERALSGSGSRGLPSGPARADVVEARPEPTSGQASASTPLASKVPRSARALWAFLRRRRKGGFTLIELTLVVVIMGLLAAIAIPRTASAVEKARYAKAIGDIRAISQALVEYQLGQNAYPASLAAVGFGSLLDPWGNPYEYLPIVGKGKGGFRKDKFLVPINSDFDLYSMGPDGETAAPLSAKKARDDVIRANDGGYVGLAENY